MKHIFFAALLIFTCCAASEHKDASLKWVQLFNGKDLTGWTPKITGYALGENFGNTFRVEDHKMIVRYDQYPDFNDRFGHIFYKQSYSYYLIAVEYRFVGDQVKGGPGWATRNSGIMLHCLVPSSMSKGQDFPISLEAQLLGGNGKDERSTLNLCTPGTDIVINGKRVTDHCINSTSKTFHGEQWVRAEVLVLGDSLLKHIVNGDTVLTYSKPEINGGNVDQANPAINIAGTPLKEGYISLQSESHPVEFRKVELIDLSAFAKDPKKLKKALASIGH